METKAKKETKDKELNHVEMSLSVGNTLIARTIRAKYAGQIYTYDGWQKLLKKDKVIK